MTYHTSEELHNEKAAFKEKAGVKKLHFRNRIHHTQVANEFLDHIAPQLKPIQVCLWLQICRLTTGFHREKATVTRATLAKRLGIRRKETVSEHLSELRKMGLIESEALEGGINRYWIPTYDSADELSDDTPPSTLERTGVVRENVRGSTRERTGVVRENVHIEEKDLRRESIRRDNDLKICPEVPSGHPPAPPSEEISNIESEEEEGTQIAVASTHPPTMQTSLETAIERRKPEEKKGLEGAVRKMCNTLELAPADDGVHLISQRDDVENLKLKPKELVSLIVSFRARGLNGVHLEACCQHLSDYIANNRKGQKYKNHAAAIRSWVLEKVLREQKFSLDLERSETDLERSHVWLERAMEG